MITCDGRETVSKHLVAFSICLYTNTFNPEKYLHLCRFLATLYKTHKTPTKLMQCFLHVFTNGSYRCTEGSFNSLDYDGKRDHFLLSPLLNVVRLFEESTWMLWSALLMKKRVVVYSSELSTLLHFTRALPLFVLHRQEWNLLRPFVDLRNPLEIQDLVQAGVYIAGFTNPQVKQQEELYDLFVDVTNQTISVAEHAKEDFVQTKFHQDFSTFIGMALQSPDVTDQKLIMAIKKKTTDLIARLQAIKQDGAISFSVLSQQNLPPNMDSFLYSLASAEGMTKI
eukprot:TRINITY_DN457_c0_g1_i11.p1 TRINITY_DN457_c0_g1~~TRINITY_DN457_c0_g1_i11.p1  ORF type:complete len:282 (+),score=60.68 TRINITY_DN457_c0_g1_i11:349-1194(+)